MRSRHAYFVLTVALRNAPLGCVPMIYHVLLVSFLCIILPTSTIVFKLVTV